MSVSPKTHFIFLCVFSTSKLLSYRDLPDTDSTSWNKKEKKKLKKNCTVYFLSGSVSTGHTKNQWFWVVYSSYLSPYGLSPSLLVLIMSYGLSLTHSNRGRQTSLKTERLKSSSSSRCWTQDQERLFSLSSHFNFVQLFRKRLTRKFHVVIFLLCIWVLLVGETSRSSRHVNSSFCPFSFPLSIWLNSCCQ
jgi:hypothetical protein